ncbi:MAG: phosphatase PAP2 family protein [Chloroflexi bacterium]|nr:phosphatase PAP2 family protein [Chloroflexota bacterium]
MLILKTLAQSGLTYLETGRGCLGAIKVITRNRYAIELGLLALGYLLYIGVKHLFVDDLEAIAFENARKVIDVELSLNIHWEPTIQGWLLDNLQSVVVFFNWVYTFGFFPILIPTAIALFLFRHKTYVLYRNVFLISFLLTWLVYLTFPVAPPRMMIEYGYVDTIEAMGPAIYNSKEALSYYNQYSAMPSMHFGWILLFSTVFLRSGVKPLRIFGAVYPALVLAAIVVTANHYILDAIVGGSIIAGSYGIYLLLRSVPSRLVRQTVAGGGSPAS